MWRSTRFAVLGAFAGLTLFVTAPAWGADAETKIVGGTTASTATYPWQAAVVYSQAQKPGKNAHQRQFCGGSLITSRIVMTAAHCVYDTDPDCSVLCSINDPGGDNTRKIDPIDVSVVLGRDTLSNSAQGEEIDVQDVSYQANYDPDLFTYDVAYLVLSTPSTQTPIQIAGADESSLWDPGSAVEVSGWGYTSEGGSTVDTLRAATVEVIADDTCGSVDIYSTDFDPVTMVCAGFLTGGVDTCNGDSGGPLEAPLEGGGYRLIGGTSWGVGCARADAPGVYSRMAGSTLRAEAVTDVIALEDANGITEHADIIGSGGEPKIAPPPVSDGEPGVSGETASADPYAKCRRIRKKKKRKRCVRKVRSRLAAGA